MSVVEEPTAEEDDAVPSLASPSVGKNELFGLETTTPLGAVVRFPADVAIPSSGVESEAREDLSRYWPSTNTPPGSLAILSLNRFNFLAQPLEDEVAALIKIGQYYDSSFNNL